MMKSEMHEKGERHRQKLLQWYHNRVAHSSVILAASLHHHLRPPRAISYIQLGAHIVYTHSEFHSDYLLYPSHRVSWTLQTLSMFQQWRSPYSLGISLGIFSSLATIASSGCHLCFMLSIYYLIFYSWMLRAFLEFRFSLEGRTSVVLPKFEMLLHVPA